MIRLFALLLFSLSLNLTQAQSNWQSAINQFVKDPSLAHASVGISVVEISNGKTIASYDADRSVVPGSALKVVTTAIALDQLGPDFRFQTKLSYDGSISPEGILRGNLYIEGSGDPTLGSDVFTATPDLSGLMQRWTDAVQAAGIQTIDGYVVGDASKFGSDANVDSWQWADLGNYYGAGAFGLNIHENYYYLRFRQTSRLGRTPEIALTEPEVPGLHFHNEIRSAGARTGDQAYIYGAPYSYMRYVRGTIPVGKGLFTIKGAVPDPPYLAAYLLAENLQEKDIKISSGAITSLQLMQQGAFSDGSRTTIFTHESPQLRQIVERTNQKSVNLYCESLLKNLATAEATTSAGLDIVQAYCKKNGIPLKGVDLRDGSGLSAKNLVTASFLSNFLRKVALNDKISKDFKASLPLAGKSGILKRKFRGTVAENNIMAKSGTISNVRSYTGYFQAKNGRDYAFTIIVNNFDGSGGRMRQKMERLMLQFCR